MLFPSPLVPARLVRRYKRFLADVEFEGGRVATAHCANPGSMLGLAEPGARVWLSPSANPARKLPWSWELVEANGALVGVNTAHPNRIAAEAILSGQIPELAFYGRLRREVAYGQNSRIDLLLEDDGPSGRPPCHVPCYVEVKSVTLSRAAGLAEFPDAVTARGAKHLDELARIAEAGGRAVMLFLVQRPDCTRFTVAADIDPAYAAGLGRALRAGVETLCYDCRVSLTGLEVAGPLRLELPGDP